ncbi:MAG: ImmA/IrrE family metallo-endopeptidase [Candidatus Margulisbacteria bacterium]|jgi:Zn-dependent peptidase ImmA (M78 family)|nr:ImmA/IrrE family metallo-endopeptidase [Candidatus Margulisiibacteriota bacterium]
MATDLSNLQNFLSNNKTPKKEYPDTITIPLIDKNNPIDSILNKVDEFRLNKNPLDIIGVIEKIFRIKLVEQDLGKSASGFLEKIGDQWFIYVNKYENESRKRFTIAHELGHFIYHSDEYSTNDTSKRDQVFFRDENTNPMEQQANDFASKLLMPEGIFYKYIQAGDNTISKLADKFQLSTAAVKYRAYKLGLISEY